MPGTVHGARLHGARYTVHGARRTAHGTSCTVQGRRCKMHGTRCTVQCTRYTVHGTRCTGCSNTPTATGGRRILKEVKESSDTGLDYRAGAFEFDDALCINMSDASWAYKNRGCQSLPEALTVRTCHGAVEQRWRDSPLHRMEKWPNHSSMSQHVSGGNAQNDPVALPRVTRHRAYLHKSLGCLCCDCCVKCFKYGTCEFLVIFGGFGYFPELLAIFPMFWLFLNVLSWFTKFSVIF